MQETRHFEEQSGTTRAGRRKETSEDYRYFPEPDLVPIAPVARSGSRSCAPRCPSCRGSGGRGSRQEWGLTDEELRDLVNAGALDLIAATVAAGAPPGEARSWWVAYLAQQANARGVRAGRAADHPGAGGAGDRAGGVGRADQQRSRARSSTACSPARATPDEVVDARGLAVVSDEGALVAAVDEALAAQPDVAEKIRGGKVAAAGAIVGAVMKATGGKADAKRVRELVLERCS